MQYRDKMQPLNNICFLSAYQYQLKHKIFASTFFKQDELRNTITFLTDKMIHSKGERGGMVDYFFSRTDTRLFTLLGV